MCYNVCENMYNNIILASGIDLRKIGRYLFDLSVQIKIFFLLPIYNKDILLVFPFSIYVPIIH